MSNAPELARLTVNIAKVHHDAAAVGGLAHLRSRASADGVGEVLDWRFAVAVA